MHERTYGQGHKSEAPITIPVGVEHGAQQASEESLDHVVRSQQQ